MKIYYNYNIMALLLSEFSTDRKIETRTCVLDLSSKNIYLTPEQKYIYKTYGVELPNENRCDLYVGNKVSSDSIEIKQLLANEIVFRSVVFDFKTIKLIHDIKSNIKRIHFVECEFKIMPKSLLTNLVFFDCFASEQSERLELKNIKVDFISSCHDTNIKTQTLKGNLTFGEHTKFNDHIPGELDVYIMSECSLDCEYKIEFDYLILVDTYIRELICKHKESKSVICINSTVDKYSGYKVIYTTTKLTQKDIELITKDHGYPKLRYALYKIMDKEI